MSNARRWSVTQEEAGERLDRHVAGRLGKPRNQVRKWILDELVKIEGRTAKPSTEVRAGENVECEPPEPNTAAGLEPEAGQLTVLYQDAELVVLDKPAGMAIHPGAGRDRGTLAHLLLHAYPEIAAVGGAGRPGIVHRLDLDTTGAVAVARSEAAYLGLTAAFAERLVRKTYVAIAYGVPRADRGRVEAPVGRHRHQRKLMQVRADGRPAVTGYRCLESAAGISRFELDLETGRTHQIRVHLKSIGHPLVGDPTYGEARWKGLPRGVQKPLRTFPRPALHAWRLAFDHPTTGARVEVEAPVPDDLRSLWRDVTGRDWA